MLSNLTTVNEVNNLSMTAPNSIADIHVQQQEINGISVGHTYPQDWGGYWVQPYQIQPAIKVYPSTTNIYYGPYRSKKDDLEDVFEESLDREVRRMLHAIKHDDISEAKLDRMLDSSILKKSLKKKAFRKLRKALIAKIRDKKATEDLTEFLEC